MVVAVGPGSPEPVEAQALHTDEPMQPVRFPSFSCLQPLEDGASLLVAVGSHHTVRQMAPKPGKRRAPEATLPYHMASRITLKASQMLIMNGNLVHAGDRGSGSEMHPRLHCHISLATPGSNVYPISVCRRALGHFAVPPERQ